MLKSICFLLWILVSVSSAFSQNSFDFYQVGKIFISEQQLNLNSKISGKLSKNKVSGTMDMSEQKLFKVKVLEINNSQLTKIEVFVDESKEIQNTNLLVAGQPNNENIVYESPLKGKTIICNYKNELWEKSILGVDSLSNEQLVALNRFGIPLYNALDFSKIPQDVKPGYKWNVGKDEADKMFGSSENNPFKNGSMKLKLKKVVNSNNENGYLWNVTLSTDNKKTNLENKSLSISMSGTLLMTNKNFILNLKGPMNLKTSQNEMTMKYNGNASLILKKHQMN